MIHNMLIQIGRMQEQLRQLEQQMGSISGHSLQGQPISSQGYNPQVGSVGNQPILQDPPFSSTSSLLAANMPPVQNDWWGREHGYPNSGYMTQEERFSSEQSNQPWPSQDQTRIGEVQQSVEEIARSPPLTVDRDTSTGNIVEIMNENNTDFVIVIEDEEPVGIVTVRRLGTRALQQENPSAVTAEEIMADPLCVRSSATISEVTSLMAGTGTEQAVVIDDEGKFTGIVTVNEILTTQAKVIDGLQDIVDIFETDSPEVDEYTLSDYRLEEIDPAVYNIDELEAIAREINNVSQLEELLEKEENNENRTGAKDLLQDRIQELS